MDRPDLLILGLDRQAIEIGLAVATLGGKVVVARTSESAVAQAIRDGEMLARLAVTADAPTFESRRMAILDDIRRQRSTERLRAARMRVEIGAAQFLDRKRVAVDDAIFQPRRVLIANGCTPPAAFEGLQALFEHGTVPPRVILRGHSPAAFELAGLLVALGSNVTLVSEQPLAPGFDPDGLRLLGDHLERQGLTRLAAMPVARAADIPVWEVGAPVPALEGLAIDKAGLRLRDGRLVLRHGFETSHSRIFAVGRAATPDQPADPGAVAHLIGRMFFRRSARFQPAPALRLIGGRLAEIGLTEKEALARGSIRIARASFADADPADASGGFVKLVADRKGRLLGASLYGPAASERMAPLALALTQGLTLAELARLSLPSGTASEAIRLAAASPARELLRSAKIQRAFRLFRIFG